MTESNHCNRILITGVAGVVGRILFNYLTEKSSNKYQVFGIDRHKNVSTRYEKQNPENLPIETIPPLSDEHFFQCDITDKQKLFELIEQLQIDTIIHLAAILEDHPDKDHLYRINIQGAQNVFEASSLFTLSIFLTINLFY